MTDTPVAVMAGTLVDTDMGARLLEDRGISTISYPLSANPREQHIFQIRSPEEKQDILREVLEDAMARGCGKAFVYCNSLSGAADFPSLERELGMRIVTPMEVYGDTARGRKRIAVIAYNPLALSGIELAMMRAEPSLTILTANLMDTVCDIEAGIAPEEIILRNHLDILMEYFGRCGAEALVLGCTHFPVIKEALSSFTALPIIDPAEEMIRKLIEI